MPSRAAGKEKVIHGSLRADRNECVILVHGLASNGMVMKPLEWRLKQQGYTTINWAYPSILSDVKTISQKLEMLLLELDQGPYDTYHLVTHSMGGIVTRALLSRASFKRLGRIVMIGPPHGGSRVAANLALVLGWVCKPLSELADHPKSYVNCLPEPSDCAIGIIACQRDRVVHVNATHLTCETDHVTAPGGHTSILFRPETAVLVGQFLRKGRFREGV